MRNRCESQVNRWRCLGIPPPIVDTNPLRCPPFGFYLFYRGGHAAAAISDIRLTRYCHQKKINFVFFKNIEIKEKKHTNDRVNDRSFFFLLLLLYEEEKGSENKTKEKKNKNCCGDGATQKRVDPERDDASPYSGSGGNQPTPHIHNTHTHTFTHTFLSISFLLSMKTTKEKQRGYTSSSIRHLNLPRLFLFFLKKKERELENISGKKNSFVCRVILQLGDDATFLIYQQKNIEEN